MQRSGIRLNLIWPVFSREKEYIIRVKTFPSIDSHHSIINSPLQLSTTSNQHFNLTQSINSLSKCNSLPSSLSSPSPSPLELYAPLPSATKGLEVQLTPLGSSPKHYSSSNHPNHRLHRHRSYSCLLRRPANHSSWRPNQFDTAFVAIQVRQDYRDRK
jgi:hypothetical protein